MYLNLQIILNTEQIWREKNTPKSPKSITKGDMAKKKFYKGTNILLNFDKSPI